MSLSYLSPFAFLLQVPLSNCTGPQKTVCLVAQALPCKIRLLSQKVFRSSSLTPFFLPLLKLPEIAKICHLALQSNKIPLLINWSSFLSISCLVSWDCPLWQWASYSHLIPWSYKTLPHTLWNFLQFIFMQAHLGSGWSFPSALPHLCLCHLLIACKLFANSRPYLFAISSFLLVGWLLYSFYFLLFHEEPLSSQWVTDVKSTPGCHILIGGPDVLSIRHPHC